MSRRSCFAAVVAVLASIAAPPFAGSASASSATITVEGSRSTSVVWNVPKTLRGNFYTLNAAHSDFRASTKGSFVGVLIRDSKGQVAAGFVAPTGWDKSGRGSVAMTWIDEEFVLRPGRYTVTLMTDGASRVTIPIDGGSSYQLHPAHPTPLLTYRADMSLSGPTPLMGTAAHGLTLPSGAIGITGLYLASSTPHHDTTTVCLRPVSPGCPYQPLKSDFEGDAASAGVASEWTYFGKGALAPGPYAVRWSYTIIGLSTRAEGFTLALR